MENYETIKIDDIRDNMEMRENLVYSINSQSKKISDQSNTFNFISNSNNHNTLNIIEEIVDENKSKKTNSTGDITPTRSPSMTQDLIDQLLLNENFLNLPAVNESQFNLNNNTNNVVNQMNKNKVNEYIQREKEMLESNNKLSFGRKKFKVIKTNVNIIKENVEKYFPLPKKSKDKERKLKIKEYYSDKLIYKEP